MSASDCQPDFTSWKRKDTHRPVLRIPLATPLSNPATQTPIPSLDSKDGAYFLQQAPASPSSTASNVSSLPNPLPSRLKKKAQKNTPTTEIEKSPKGGNLAALQQNHSRDTETETSITGSASVTDSEQLMRVRLRLLEEEQNTLRRALRERVKQATDCLSFSSLKTPAMPAEESSTPSCDSRGPICASLPSSQSAASVDGNKRGNAAAVKRNKSDSSSCGTVSNGPTLQTLQSSTQASSASPCNEQGTQLNNTKKYSPVEAVEGQLSPPVQKPVGVSSSIDVVNAEQPAASAAAPHLPLPPPPPRELQPAQSLPQEQPSLMGPLHPHYHYQLTLDQLRHDVGNCAREIERLVEDQYDLRCSVRDMLLEMSRANAAAGGVAQAPTTAASAPMTISSLVSDSTQIPEKNIEQEQVANQVPPHNDDNEYPNTRHYTSDPYSGRKFALGPPPWLLPWLQQLHNEQNEKLQQLREEMVVMVCRVVTEVRHASSDPESSGEGRTSRSPCSPAPKQAVARTPDQPTNKMVEPNPQSLRVQDTRVEEPPSSLLWQRYRRLMSPTPLNRSELMSSATSSVAPSEMSLRGQDALWSALLHMQRVVDAQSSQIAQLTESVLRPSTTAGSPEAPISLPEPPQQRCHHRSPPKHQEDYKPSESTVKSTDTTTSSTTATTSYTVSTCTSASVATSSETCSNNSPTPPHRRNNSHHHHHRHRSRSHSKAQCPSPVETKQRSRHRSRPPLGASSSPKKEEQQQTCRLDAIQDEMSELRQLLRETLERDRQLAQQTPVTPLSEHSHYCTFRKHQQKQQHERYHDLSSVSDSDVRSSKYAQRRYVETDYSQPPARTSSRHAAPRTISTTVATPATTRPVAYANGYGAGRSLHTEDTRYARGVMPLQQQQQQQHPRTPNPRPGSSENYCIPSPSVSPINEDWMEEDVFAGDAAAIGTRQEGGDVLETPPQLPRQRVRTTLTSALMCPR